MTASRPGTGAAALAAFLCLGLGLGPAPVAVARPAPDNFADLAARLLPSVVNVSTTETVSGAAADDDDDDDDASPAPSPSGPSPSAPAPSAPVPPGSPFEKLFRDFMRNHGGAAPDAGTDAAKRKVQSLGSGFVIDPSGLIVTNNHVVKGADAITVTLQDDSVLKAKLLGHDDRSDLALLKVDPPHPLTAVRFGSSDGVRVGDWVLAIGNPFGLSGTVTAGIVSSRGRSLDDGPYDDFIQTDAPINRGNSGGPLFDMDGRVIGINTAIYSPSGGSIGIGFSIPSNEAVPVIDQLEHSGRVRHGAIGVRVQDLTPDIARGFGLPEGTSGALVAGVEPDGPAARAGIGPGDVIEAVNDEAVNGRTLPRVVREAPVGRAVPVTLWRRGRRVTASVTVAERPEADAAAAKTASPSAAPKPTAVALPGLGLSVAPLDAAARSRYAVADDVKGAVVASVQPGGAAASGGIKPGDVVTAAGSDEVGDPDQLRTLVTTARRARRPVLALLLQNGDAVRWVPLPLGAGPVPP